jgi:hypothetical protein
MYANNVVNVRIVPRDERNVILPKDNAVKPIIEATKAILIGLNTPDIISESAFCTSSFFLSSLYLDTVCIPKSIAMPIPIEIDPEVAGLKFRPSHPNTPIPVSIPKISAERDVKPYVIDLKRNITTTNTPIIDSSEVCPCVLLLSAWKA